MLVNHNSTYSNVFVGTNSFVVLVKDQSRLGIPTDSANKRDGLAIFDLDVFRLSVHFNKGTSHGRGGLLFSLLFYLGIRPWNQEQHVYEQNTTCLYLLNTN